MGKPSFPLSLDITITGDEEVSLNIDGLGDHLPRILTGVITRQSRAAARVLKREVQSKLKGTGKLASSAVPFPMEVKGSSITGRAGFLAKQRYKAAIHVGPRGSSRILRAKKSEYLAIPLPGVTTRRPRRGSDTFVARSRAGNLLVAHRQHGGEFLPLFVLKKQIRVPRRVFLDEIVQGLHPKVVKDFEDSIQKEID